MFHPTISPHDPNTVLLSCDMTGSYISHDGGQSWRMFSLRGVVRFFVFDPQDGNVIYAQADGLWRSRDRGDTWSLVYPKASSLKDIKMSSDHADEDLIAEPNLLGNITAMTIDPADSRIIYVVAGDKKRGLSALFISRDEGAGWTKQEDLPELADKVWVNPHSPESGRILFIAGAHFMMKKDSSEGKQIPLPPAKTLADASAGFTNEGKAILYVVGDDSGFVSDDDGTTWRKVYLGGGGEKVRAIATSFNNPQTAYVSYRERRRPGWQPLLRNRPGKNHADDGRRRKLGRGVFTKVRKKGMDDYRPRCHKFIRLPF